VNKDDDDDLHYVKIDPNTNSACKHIWGRDVF